MKEEEIKKYIKEINRIRRMKNELLQMEYRLFRAFKKVIKASGTSKLSDQLKVSVYERANWDQDKLKLIKGQNKLPFFPFKTQLVENRAKVAMLKEEFPSAYKVLSKAIKSINDKPQFKIENVELEPVLRWKDLKKAK